jgi:Pectate lyase superfamily protein
MGRLRRPAVLALVGVVIVVVAAVVLLRGRGTGTNSAPPVGSTVATVPAPLPPPQPGLAQGELVATGTTVTPDPRATSVRTTGALGDGVHDDTAAFESAMDSALAGTHRFAQGPSGQPQAVVSVPPGTYRLFRLTFRSNIRLEVDAGAVLEQAGGINAAQNDANAAYLIIWDGTSATAPLQNVSIVGVGSHTGGVKDLADPVQPGWNIANSFTMDLDPRTTNASQKVGGMQLLNIDSFLIQNVFSIENATVANAASMIANSGVYPWPTSSKAVILLRPRNDSPPGGPYADPHNGTITHLYNISGPYGYGPDQVTSGHNINISQVYSMGGTALRLETDATKNKSFGGEVRGLTADTVMGVDCNRAVSFSPHGQNNYDVHVSNVVALSCHQGVVEAADESLSGAKRGAFFDSTISDVEVIAGSEAQDPAPGGASAGAWVVGPSLQSVARDPKATWAVTYRDVSCRGQFAMAANPITIGGTVQTPTCQ